MLAYEVFENNKVRVYGGGLNVIYPKKPTGEAFANYAEAEAFALAKIDQINKERIGIQNLYIHVSLSGGDGRNDPIGVENNGTDKMHVICTTRLDIDPSSDIVSSMPDKAWRIKLLHEDGSEYETISVNMVSGIIEFDYFTANLKTGLVSIDQQSLDEVFEVNGYKYKIMVTGDTQFKVYRNF